MKKYRKKPVIIEAEQWFKVGFDREAKGTTPKVTIVCHLTVDYYRHPEKKHGSLLCSICNVRRYNHGWIKTLEGGHIVCPGDWIIKGLKGEFYPCKPDIFKETYEEIE